MLCLIGLSLFVACARAPSNLTDNDNAPVDSTINWSDMLSFTDSLFKSEELLRQNRQEKPFDIQIPDSSYDIQEMNIVGDTLFTKILSVLNFDTARRADISDEEMIRMLKIIRTEIQATLMAARKQLNAVWDNRNYSDRSKR